MLLALTVLAACTRPAGIEIAEVGRTGPSLAVGDVDCSGYPDLSVDVLVIGADGRPATDLVSGRLAIEPRGEGPLVRPARVDHLVPLSDAADSGRPVLEIVFVLGGDIDRSVSDWDSTTVREAVVRLLDQRLDASVRAGVVLVEAGRTIGPGLEPAEVARQLESASTSKAPPRPTAAELGRAAAGAAPVARVVVAVPGPAEPGPGGHLTVDTGGRRVWVLATGGADSGLWRRVAGATGGQCLEMEGGESGVLALSRVVQLARSHELSGRYRIACRSGVVDPTAEQAYILEVDPGTSNEIRGEMRFAVERRSVEAALEAAIPELLREAKETARTRGPEPAVELLVALRAARPDSEPAQAALASILGEEASRWLALGEDARAMELLGSRISDPARSDRVIAERVAEAFFEAARDRRRGDEAERALALTDAVRRHLPGISAATERELALRARFRQLLEDDGLGPFSAEVARQAATPSVVAAAREVVLERCRSLAVDGGMPELIALGRELERIDAGWSRAVRAEVAAMVQGAVDAAIGRGDLAQAERWIALAEDGGDPSSWRSRRYALARRAAEIALGGPRQDRVRAIESLSRALELAPPGESREVEADLVRVASEEAEQRASRGELAPARTLLDQIRALTGEGGRSGLDRAQSRVAFHAGRAAREAGDWEGARSAWMASIGGVGALGPAEVREGEAGAIEALARLGEWDQLARLVEERGLHPGHSYLAPCAESVARAWGYEGDVAAGRSEWREAVRSYSEAVSWHRDRETMEKLVDAHLAAGDPESAARGLLEEAPAGEGEQPERVARSLLAAGRPEGVLAILARSGGALPLHVVLELLLSAHFLMVGRDASALAGSAMDRVPEILASFEGVIRADLVDRQGAVPASSAADSGKAHTGQLPDTASGGLAAATIAGEGVVVVDTGGGRLVIRHRVRPTTALASAVGQATKAGDWAGVVAAVAAEMSAPWARAAAVLAGAGLARSVEAGEDVAGRLDAIRRVAERRGGEYAAVSSAALASRFTTGPVEAPGDPRADGAASTYRTHREWEGGMGAVEYAHPIYVGAERWGIVRWGVLDGGKETHK